MATGAFCSRKHPHFNMLPTHLEAIHFAQSDKMRDFLSIEIGKLWDTWPSEWNMNSFWKEYCEAPWDNWSLGSFTCMLCTPSQQAQESWHKQILQSRIPGLFKGSTEQVLHVALPQLVHIDGALIPNQLLFHVPDVPASMFEKALWFWRRHSTYMLQASAGRGMQRFHVLSASQTKYRRVDEKLVGWHDSLLLGVRPRGVTKLEDFLHIASALHVVEYAHDAGRKAVPCEYNEAELVCTCKCCRHVGICSHILLVSHLLQFIDLENILGIVSGEKRKRGGFTKGTRPALVREENELALLIQEKRARMEEERRIKERVNREMTEYFDVGIRVNRALQKGMGQQ